MWLADHHAHRRPRLVIATISAGPGVSGKNSVAEVWPQLELIVHGGVKFDPYRESFATILGSPAIQLQEAYPCSEGFIAFGDPATGLLRLVCDHGLFFEFVPVAELGSHSPVRHWLGTVETGVNYAIVVSTCAGLWAHVIGDTIRFESRDQPLISFTGRTRYTLSAFGEHLISEEVEGAIARASAETGGCVRDWHVGPVFAGGMGYHQFVIEFLTAARCHGTVSELRSTPTWADVTPIIRHTGVPARACHRPRRSSPRAPADSIPGCDAEASLGDKTRCPEWMTRGR